MGMGYAYIVPTDNVAGIQKVVKGAKVVGEITEEPGACAAGYRNYVTFFIY